MGVYSENLVDKKFASNIIKLAEEREIDIILKTYDNYNDILSELNEFKLDLAIVPEERYSDSYLGLNEYTKKKYTNNEFVIGINFNYFYMVSDLFYKDTERSKRITQFSDITLFKKTNKRHFIIGTENKSTYSYRFLIILLRMYGMNGISFSNYNENEQYDENVVFIITESKENLYSRFTVKKVDAIFLFDIYHSRFVSQLVKNNEAIFLNFDLETTVFDDILSSYFKKETIRINSFYSNKIGKFFTKNNITPKNGITYFNEIDLDEQLKQLEQDEIEEQLNQITSNLGEFTTRKMRSCLLSNNLISKDIIYKLANIILRNNNYIINKVYYNKFSNSEHNLFEPIDIIYLNETLSYHTGASQLYEEMKFISYDKRDVKLANADSDEKFDYYWKYSKIGLKQFTFKD